MDGAWAVAFWIQAVLAQNADRVMTAGAWTEWAVAMRVFGEVIRIERMGDTQPDNVTERSNLARTGYPSAQKKKKKKAGMGVWVAECGVGFVLSHWTQSCGRDKTFRNNRSFGRWTGRYWTGRSKRLKNGSIELAIAAWRLHSYRGSYSPHSSVGRRVYLDALESCRGHG